jgi:hypothetical protein
VYKRQLEDQLGLALDAMDDGSRPLLESAEKVTRRTAKRAEGSPHARVGAASRGGVNPRASNRGVRSPKTAQTGTKKGGSSGGV